MSDMITLTSRAKVAHAALEHCRLNGVCNTCPLSEECNGEINVLLGMAADVLAELLHDRLIEDSKKAGGLTVRCHLDACDCEELRGDGWCGRFGRYCSDIHCEEEREDE